MRLRNGMHLNKMKLTRGSLYWVTFVGFYSGKPRYRWCLCQFIQVTKKGFNFLNLKTSKCMTYSHFYAIGCGGRPLPKEKDTFYFYVPACMAIYESMLSSLPR